MNLKNILVYLDKSHHSMVTLELALGLAKQHEAKLTALYIITHKYHEPQHVDTESKRAQIQAEFEMKIGAVGVDAELLVVEMAATGASIAEIVNHHAYYSDLVIIAQTDFGAPDKDTPTGLAEHLILGSGRPVLIVPYVASYKNFATRILVAWKPGRASTRTVSDSLPLLANADAVKVLVVNPLGFVENEGKKLCAHLACHNIKANVVEATSSGVTVGDVLIKRASTEESNLLVMGAYAP
ncbi:MAG: universal stress protein, partial [Chlorobium sp.]|nr:universal stress protein [Chlorobium sp.]